MLRVKLAALVVAVMAISMAQAGPVRVVAAENVYGDIAAQIGGAGVAVTSILSNPTQDPHLFEASASTARAIADARLVIYNGAGYDPWAIKLLSASPSSSREIIVVAKLIGKRTGDNPHLWYEPAAAPVLAKVIAAGLSKLDPARSAAYAEHLAAFETSLKPLARKIAALRTKYAGTPVTATEPVFGYMADALGLSMRNAGFQRTIMNGTEPSAAEIAAFEKDLRTRAVRVLLYNRQTSETQTERMKAIAVKSGVPVVGVTETEPPGMNYQTWMLSQLDSLDLALGGR
jgi:zinc/manganese transport system substrate-binding protein